MQGLNEKKTSFQALLFLLALVFSLTWTADSLLASSAPDKPEGEMQQDEVQQVIESSQRLNINQASVEQLTSLPGIGPVRAADLVEWREQQGSFMTLDDLQQIKGIGPATAAKLEPLISF